MLVVYASRLRLLAQNISLLLRRAPSFARASPYLLRWKKNILFPTKLTNDVHFSNYRVLAFEGRSRWRKRILSRASRTRSSPCSLKSRSGIHVCFDRQMRGRVTSLHDANKSANGNPRDRREVEDTDEPQHEGFFLLRICPFRSSLIYFFASMRQECLNKRQGPFIDWNSMIIEHRAIPQLVRIDDSSLKSKRNPIAFLMCANGVDCITIVLMVDAKGKLALCQSINYAELLRDLFSSLRRRIFCYPPDNHSEEARMKKCEMKNVFGGKEKRFSHMWTKWPSPMIFFKINHRHKIVTYRLSRRSNDDLFAVQES